MNMLKTEMFNKIMKVIQDNREEPCYCDTDIMLYIEGILDCYITVEKIFNLTPGEELRYTILNPITNYDANDNEFFEVNDIDEEFLK